MTAIYVTLDDLAAGQRSMDRLAEAASPDNTDVDGAILAVAIAGGDLSAHDADVQAAARSAVAWLRDEVTAANAEADAYIAPRYAVLLADDIPAGVKVYVLDIARYRIFGGDEDSVEARKYRAAMVYFRDVAAGKIDLDVPRSADGGGRPVAAVLAPTRRFDDAGLVGY